MTGLAAEMGVRRGGFVLEVALEAGADETVALAGPSGAGKTTALRLLAGVDALERGHILLDRDVLDDPDAGRFVPAERRRVGWLPQGGVLFPHLDAADNVAFGLRRRGTSRADARRRGEAWLERVGLAGRGASKPTDLSGGEARRVALARALAPEPRLLLLDEPFAGLDLGARADLRRILREALPGRGCVRVVVAHEPLDALSLGDSVVVVEDGRVTQSGSPVELCERPATPYVGELAGLNLLRGVGILAEGRALVELPRGRLRVVSRVDGPVLAAFRPSAVGLYRVPPSGSPRNLLEGTVAEVSPSGERVRVRVESDPPVVAELTPEAATELEVRPGQRVWASVKATEIDVWPA